MHKYKVGDKAKVIGNTCMHDREIGDIITIQRIRDNHSYNYNAGGWYINEQDIEPIGKDNKNGNFINNGQKFSFKQQ